MQHDVNSILLEQLTNNICQFMIGMQLTLCFNLGYSYNKCLYAFMNLSIFS